MNDAPDAARLTDRVAALVEAARKAGGDAADAVAVRGRSTSVSVRLGKVESTNSSEGDDVSLRVFVGSRVASVSATASAFRWAWSQAATERMSAADEAKTRKGRNELGIGKNPVKGIGQSAAR